MSRLSSVGAVEAGERIKALRKALKLSQDEVVRRSGGLLDRPMVIRIEKGESKLQSHRARAGLARAFGVGRSYVDALVEGEISVDTVLSLLRAPTAELSSPASRGAGTAPSPAEIGEAMGTAIQLRDLPLTRFPNLEFCLEYHRRSRKVWDPSVVAAARSGHFGDSDLPTTYQWERALDELQQVMARAREAHIESSRSTVDEGKKP